MCFEVEGQLQNLYFFFQVPATREVLSSLPSVLSALCLNTRGLQAFMSCKPFDKLFRVLLSPDYLPAMRRRRTSESLGRIIIALLNIVMLRRTYICSWLILLGVNNFRIHGIVGICNFKSCHVVVCQTNAILIQSSIFASLDCL